MTKFDPTDPPAPIIVGANSFAHQTMTERQPAMLMQLLDDHSFPDAIVDAIRQLHAELTENKPVAPLQSVASDAGHWATVLRPYHDHHWLDLPWYLAEAFMFRRVTEATNYFGSRSDLRQWQGLDPFLPRKREELSSEAPWQVLEAVLRASEEDAEKRLWAGLHFGVWGNRIDLSYTEVADSSGRSIAVEQEQENLLVDDSRAVVSYFQQGNGAGMVDIICDNAGTELLMDLALADTLLRDGWTAQVTLHVKAHPTYVSDATPADVEMSIAAMAKREPHQALAAHLRAALLRTTLRIRADWFWNSSQFFWKMPPALTGELSASKLLVFKGDANYRRLLGDHIWPATVPLANAVPYLPAPFLALRTMKSDPVVGLRSGQAEQLHVADAEWRVNGKRGLIQAVI